MNPDIELLRKHGIPVTPQRLAVLQHVTKSQIHPSADEVWELVKETCPTISRATVYNTLNLLVEKGLLKRQILKSGKVVFDPLLTPHHHFIDEQTSAIYNIPWDAIHVSGYESLTEFEIVDHQVVLRGRVKPKP